MRFAYIATTIPIEAAAELHMKNEMGLKVKL